MSYTKLDPQPSGLQAGETAVQLDSGDLVAVVAVSGVQANTGNATVTANARVINADGTNKLDALDQPMESSMAYTCGPTDDVPTAQKCCLMAVLGEPTTPMWTDAIHATFLANANIRTNIASAAHAGQVNTANLL